MALTIVTLREDTRDAKLGVSISTFPRQKPILTNIQHDGAFARATNLSTHCAWYVVAVAALGSTPKGTPTITRVGDLYAAEALPAFISRTRPLTMVVTADAALAERAHLINVAEATKLANGKLQLAADVTVTVLLVSGAAPTALDMDVPAGAWCIVEQAVERVAPEPGGLLARIGSLLQPDTPKAAVEPPANTPAEPPVAHEAPHEATHTTPPKTAPSSQAAQAAPKSTPTSMQSQLWEMLFGSY